MPPASAAATRHRLRLAGRPAESAVIVSLTGPIFVVISKTSICTGLRILVTVVVGCSLRIVIIGSFIFIGHPVIIDSRFIIGAVIIGQRGVGIFAAVVAVRTIVIVVFCGIIIKIIRVEDFYLLIKILR